MTFELSLLKQNEDEHVVGYRPYTREVFGHSVYIFRGITSRLYWTKRRRMVRKWKKTIYKE